jgi:hypothetical protein
VLRVFGKRFRPERVLAQVTLPVVNVYHKGERLAAGARFVTKAGGFLIVVSPRGRKLDSQIRDANRFLKRYRAKLARIVAHAAVDDMILSFGVLYWIDKGEVMRSIRFPPELLRLAGELDIEVQLAAYPTSSE